MKKVLSILLALCLLCSITLTASAARPGMDHVDTPEAFLNRWLIAGSGGNDYDCEQPSYASVLQHCIFNMLSGLRLETYGIKLDWDRRLSKNRISLSDARWLCENILNWPTGAWEEMVQQAQNNKGYLGASNKVELRGDYLYGPDPAGLAFGTGIRVVSRQQSGSRLEMVFDFYAGSHNDTEPPMYDGRFYAMLEQKNLNGKNYWTLRRIRELDDNENPLAVGGFDDVATTDFFADPVVWAVENGITNGAGKGAFNPKGSCTRGQIVTFLWRACGSPEPESTASLFADIQDSAQYYYKAVLWAVENNITGGTGNGQFSPGKTCTRDQAVTFLWRAQGQPETASSSSFTDVKPGSFYEAAVNWAVENGITGGTGNGKFSPGKMCTRGEIVTFLYRAAQNTGA